MFSNKKLRKTLTAYFMVLTFYGHPAYNPLWLTDQKMFSNKIAPFTKSFNRTVIPVFFYFPLSFYTLSQETHVQLCFTST